MASLIAKNPSGSAVQVDSTMSEIVPAPSDAAHSSPHQHPQLHVDTANSTAPPGDEGDAPFSWWTPTHRHHHIGNGRAPLHLGSAPTAGHGHPLSIQRALLPSVRTVSRSRSPHRTSTQTAPRTIPPSASAAPSVAVRRATWQNTLLETQATAEQRETLPGAPLRLPSPIAESAESESPVDSKVPSALPSMVPSPRRSVQQVAWILVALALAFGLQVLTSRRSVYSWESA
ncbi:hypothetical protein C8Q77DRAFT_300550 [Trametes polyzona]|nr:hypothetical protein C8Q77DRAFT_300550 [Trametes polyzona]